MERSLVYNIKQFIYDNFDGPKDVVVAVLMILGALIIASVGLWAAFVHLPVWGALLVIGGLSVMIGGLISES